jgi:hypothetical protein
MMDCSTARKILGEAADLIRLTTIFKAQYGKDYIIDVNSPDDAWQQQRQIFEHQKRIAAMLDPKAVAEACPRFGKWWERHSVLDPAIAHELLNQTGYLIAYCGHRQVTDNDSSHIIHSTQCVIAGILHPKSREMLQPV